jgi:hypothetical protein
MLLTAAVLRSTIPYPGALPGPNGKYMFGEHSAAEWAAAAPKPRYKIEKMPVAACLKWDPVKRGTCDQLGTVFRDWKIVQ